MLRLYQQLKETTLLRHPAVSRLTFSFRAEFPKFPREESGSSPGHEEIKAERAAAAQALEKVLAAKDLVLVPDGEKFMFLIPRAKVAETKPAAAASLAANRWGLNAERIPIGMINFIGADVQQVIPFYASLVSRELGSRPKVPQGEIWFCNQTVITTQEAAYALDTLLGWNGIKLVPVGTNQVGVLGGESRGGAW